FYLWYNDYASMHYMDVPKEIKESALKILKEDSVINSMIEADRYFVENYDQMQREDWYQVIGLLSIEKANAVRNLLTTSYAYSTKLDRIGDKVDPVMYFLNESKEGYCAHFASAGVMMLRSLGVPARYASGYVVRDSRFKRNATGKYAAPVLDSYAHSWVEIYVENYGWIPFDMTPGEGGFSNAPSGGGNEIVTENTSDTVNEITENTTEKVTASTETSETSTDEINVTEAATEDTDAPGKTVKKPDKTAVVILVIVITLVAAASTALIILYLKLRKKRLINDAMTKIAEGTDIEENILLLDHMLLKLMRNILSMRRGRMTDEEYLKNLKKAFPSFSAEEWEKYVEILQKIHYSKQKLAFGGKEAGEVCIKIFKGTVCK
ncbi:MAG: transglutaminase domain-containing protein, partial [Eubacterium sp.]|nr:transglutaminase domain-containing protein [Eubacterium sp.]